MILNGSIQARFLKAQQGAAWEEHWEMQMSRLSKIYQIRDGDATSKSSIVDSHNAELSLARAGEKHCHHVTVPTGSPEARLMSLGFGRYNCNTMLL